MRAVAAARAVLGRPVGGRPGCRTAPLRAGADGAPGAFVRGPTGPSVRAGPPRAGQRAGLRLRQRDRRARHLAVGLPPEPARQPRCGRGPLGGARRTRAAHRGGDPGVVRAAVVGRLRRPGEGAGTGRGIGHTLVRRQLRLQRDRQRRREPHLGHTRTARGLPGVGGARADRARRRGHPAGLGARLVGAGPPRVSRTLLDGAGHLPWVERPHAFRAAVGDFLARELPFHGR